MSINSIIKIITFFKYTVIYIMALNKKSYKVFFKYKCKKIGK